MHPTIDKITYSYLIFNNLHIIKCTNIQNINISNTYKVIINAEPINCFKSTANPIVERKIKDKNNPKSKFPLNFFTGFN